MNPPAFTQLVDLASERVGGKVLTTTDDFFAPKENLIRFQPAIFLPHKYTPRGKWMDGWESRRKRTPGHDWVVMHLGCPGVLRGVNIDTSHFLGNYPEFASIEASEKSLHWEEILPKVPLKGGGDNFFEIQSDKRWTHLKLHIYPDGGVARFRAYGEVKPDWEKLKKRPGGVDLAAIENGGIVLGCNDNFFGPKDNLIMPGRAKTMGEGWETRRRRRPGNDWIVVKLGAPGKIKKIELDTNHFKGNYPDSASIEGGNFDRDPVSLDDASLQWEPILPQKKLKAHFRHYYEKDLKAKDKVFTHLRLQIYPDGGISRMRVHGVPA